MAKLTSLQTKSNLIPATAFHQLPYWKILDEKDQKKAEFETQEIARSLFHEGASRLEQGKHLLELQKTLEPYRIFVRHIRSVFKKMSLKTAYRRIGEYENAKKKFPEPVLQALLARGLDVVGETSDKPYGKYTPILKQLPPPKTDDKYKINEWMDNVENKYKEYRSDLRNGLPLSFESAHQSPDTLMKSAFRHVRVRFKRVPKGQQHKWLKTLTSYLLAELGSPETITVDATEAPEEFRRGPGKPRADGATA